MAIDHAQEVESRACHQAEVADEEVNLGHPVEHRSDIFLRISRGELRVREEEHLFVRKRVRVRVRVRVGQEGLGRVGKGGRVS